MGDGVDRGGLKYTAEVDGNWRAELPDLRALLQGVAADLQALKGLGGQIATISASAPGSASASAQTITRSTQNVSSQIRQYKKSYTDWLKTVAGEESKVNKQIVKDEESALQRRAKRLQDNVKARADAQAKEDAIMEAALARSAKRDAEDQQRYEEHERRKSEALKRETATRSKDLAVERSQDAKNREAELARGQDAIKARAAAQAKEESLMQAALAASQKRQEEDARRYEEHEKRKTEATKRQTESRARDLEIERKQDEKNRASELKRARATLFQGPTESRSLKDRIREFLGLADATGKAEAHGSRLMFTFRRLFGILALFTIAREVAAGFKSILAAAILLNAQIEQNVLGIASLILASNAVRDIQGNVVTGAQGLTLASTEARKQLFLLRQDALRTSATFEELTQAFQVAVAPGLGAGLNLDQIREFSVRIAQAAAALGLERNQLAEEIRSILEGTIQARTTRIATALGISNEDIRNAKEAGKLAEFLKQRFSAFEAVGKVADQTFTVLLSNLRDGLEQTLTSGAVGFFTEVKGLIGDILKLTLQRNNISGMFEPNPAFVEFIETVFQGLQNAVGYARELIQNLNKDDLLAIAQALGNIFTWIGASLTGAVEGLSNGLGNVLTVVNAVFGGLAQHADLIKQIVSFVTEWLVVFFAIKGTITLVVGLIGTVLTLTTAISTAIQSSVILWTSVSVILRGIVALLTTGFLPTLQAIAVASLAVARNLAFAIAQFVVVNPLVAALLVTVGALVIATGEFNRAASSQDAFDPALERAKQLKIVLESLPSVIQQSYKSLFESLDLVKKFKEELAKARFDLAVSDAIRGLVPSLAETIKLVKDAQFEHREEMEKLDKSQKEFQDKRLAAEQKIAEILKQEQGASASFAAGGGGGSFERRLQNAAEHMERLQKMANDRATAEARVNQLMEEQNKLAVQSQAVRAVDSQIADQRKTLASLEEQAKETLANRLRKSRQTVNAEIDEAKKALEALGKKREEALAQTSSGKANVTELKQQQEEVRKLAFQLELLGQQGPETFGLTEQGMSLAREFFTLNSQVAASNQDLLKVDEDRKKIQQQINEEISNRLTQLGRERQFELTTQNKLAALREQAQRDLISNRKITNSAFVADLIEARNRQAELLVQRDIEIDKLNKSRAAFNEQIEALRKKGVSEEAILALEQAQRSEEEAITRAINEAGLELESFRVGLLDVLQITEEIAKIEEENAELRAKIRSEESDNASVGQSRAVQQLNRLRSEQDELRTARANEQRQLDRRTASFERDLSLARQNGATAEEIGLLQRRFDQERIQAQLRIQLLSIEIYGINIKMAEVIGQANRDLRQTILSLQQQANETRDNQINTQIEEETQARLFRARNASENVKALIELRGEQAKLVAERDSEIRSMRLARELFDVMIEQKQAEGASQAEINGLIENQIAQEELLSLKIAAKNRQIEETNILVAEAAVRASNSASDIGAQVQLALRDQIQQLPDQYTQVVNTLEGIISGFGSFISASIVNAFDPNNQQSIKERFASFLRDLAKMIIDTLVRVAIVRSLAFAFGANGGGQVPAATQGFVRGGEVHPFARARGYSSGGRTSRNRSPRGRPRGLHPSDTVPIWAAPGEWVIRAASALKYGPKVMAAINDGLINPMSLRGLANVAHGSRVAVASSGPGMALGGEIAAKSLSGAPARTDGDSGVSQTVVLPVVPASEQTVNTLLTGGRAAMLDFIGSNADEINARLNK